MRPGRDSFPSRARGFTLLEIILAMFVLVLLVSAIFSIVGGTTQLADEMERAHERDARVHSFAQFCERTLRNLPANAQIRMRVKQGGNRYLGELTLKNAPSPIGATGANGMTVLRTEATTDGYMRIWLEMMTDEEATASELGKGESPKQRLLLLDNVAKCEWKFYNPLSLEWEPVWNEKISFAPSTSSGLTTPTGGNLQVPTPPAGAPNSPTPPPAEAARSLSLAVGARRPSLVELIFAIGADAPRRFVFWVPPVTAPGGAGASNTPPPTGQQLDTPPAAGTVIPPPPIIRK